MDANEHFYEACYQTWRAGYNPDRVNYDRSDDDYYNGMTPEYTAGREIKTQHRQREFKRQQEQAEQICYGCEVCCNCYGQ